MTQFQIKEQSLEAYRLTGIKRARTCPGSLACCADSLGDEFLVARHSGKERVCKQVHPVAAVADVFRAPVYLVQQRGSLRPGVPFIAATTAAAVSGVLAGDRILARAAAETVQPRRVQVDRRFRRCGTVPRPWALPRADTPASHVTGTVSRTFHRTSSLPQKPRPIAAPYSGDELTP